MFSYTITFIQDNNITLHIFILVGTDRLTFGDASTLGRNYRGRNDWGQIDLLPHENA